MMRLAPASVGWVLALAVGATGAAQQTAPAPPPIVQEPQMLLLWPNGAPGAQGTEDRDKPAITVYMPPNTTGPMTAVIIAPGGSYRALASNLEGRAPANYFNALGIAAFVLRYRLGP
jgi:acetyl esterase/lipase